MISSDHGLRLVHRKILAVALTLSVAACSSDSPTEPIDDGLIVDSLVTELDYPSSVAVGESEVYIIEALDRLTVFDGRMRLSSYAPGIGGLTPVLDDPANYLGLTVGVSGDLYVGGATGTIPGDNGSVTVVDPLTGVESLLVNVPAAVRKVDVDSSGDLILLGMSDTPTAPGLMRLPGPSLSTVDTLAQGLGRVFALTTVDEDIYFSDRDGINRFDGAVTPVLIRESIVISMTRDGDFVYFGDFDGRVARLDVTSGDVLTITTGLESVLDLAFDPVGKQLYFVQGGTAAAEYHDGVLGVVRNLP